MLRYSKIKEHELYTYRETRGTQGGCYSQPFKTLKQAQQWACEETQFETMWLICMEESTSGNRYKLVNYDELEQRKFYQYEDKFEIIEKYQWGKIGDLVRHSQHHDTLFVITRNYGYQHIDNRCRIEQAEFFSLKRVSDGTCWSGFARDLEVV